MSSAILWVGLVVTAVAFIVDGVLWSFVFNKGLDHLVDKDDAKKSMAGFMVKQFGNTLIFGYFFSAFWAMVGSALPAKGIAGGLEFGLLLWLPAVAHEALANSIWFAKARPLAKATAWSALAKFLICGAVVSLFL